MDKTDSVPTMNKPESTIRDSSFLLGVASTVPFVFGGFVTFLIAISEGQLIVPPWFFLLFPVPFGVVFALFAFKLRLKLQERTRWARFSAFTLGVDLVLIVWLFVLLMRELEFGGVLRWM